MSESLVSRLLAQASAHPGDAAIVDERRTVTYGELARRVLGAAARLAALGVCAGDTVAISFRESRDQVVEFTSVLYGAGYLGAAVLPLYPDVLEGRRRELVAALNARWCVATEASDLGVATFGLADVCDKFHTAGTQPPRLDDAERPFFYQFSSGSTGKPKAILFSHAQLCINSLVTLTHYGLGRADKVLPQVPAPAKAGLRYVLRALAGGGTFINLPFPTTRRSLGKLVADYGITAAMSSPWQLRRLATSPQGEAPVQLRALVCIGAMVSPEDVAMFRTSVSPHLYVSYSSTECGGLALLGPSDPVDDGYGIFPQVALEIVDDRHTPLPAGKTGLIRARVPAMPTGYAGNPEASALRFRAGWFYPGDAGRLDARQRLFVQGRSDGTINFGGVKVVAEEVEAVLLAHPDLADAAVAAVPDAMAGEVPVALVMARRAVTPEALRAFCLARIDGLSVPAGFLFVDRLPRTADGKLNRVQLAKQARAIARIDHPGAS